MQQISSKSTALKLICFVLLSMPPFAACTKLHDDSSSKSSVDQSNSVNSDGEASLDDFTGDTETFEATTDTININVNETETETIDTIDSDISETETEPYATSPNNQNSPSISLSKNEAQSEVGKPTNTTVTEPSDTFTEDTNKTTVSSPQITSAILTSKGDISVSGHLLTNFVEYFLVDENNLRQHLYPTNQSDDSLTLVSLQLIDVNQTQKYSVAYTDDQLQEHQVPLDTSVFETLNDTPAPKISKVINVKSDFGAIGKYTDDTKALQSAFDDVGSVADGDLPTIVIPSGAYFIQGTSLHLSGKMQIISDGHAIIYQSCDTCAIFEIDDLSEIKISGVRFSGGKNAIVVNSINNDSDKQATLRIDQSEFGAQKSFAIQASELDLTSFKTENAILFVNQSRFINPAQMISSNFSLSVLRDSWVVFGQPNTPDNKAGFLNGYGTMILDGMLGNPVFGAGTTSWPRTELGRWIDNYGSVFVLNTRSGGESGGVGILHNYRGASESVSNNVVMENSALSSGAGFADAGIIQFSGDDLANFPQNSWIAGNRSLIGGYSNAKYGSYFTWRTSKNFDAAKFKPTLNSSEIFIGDNETTITDAQNLLGFGTGTIITMTQLFELIPKILHQHLQPYLSTDKAEKPHIPIFLTPSPIFRPWDNPKFTNDVVINVKDYGAIGDGITDDTAAINKAIKGAQKYITHTPKNGIQMMSGPALYFPDGNYLITNELDFSYYFKGSYHGRVFQIIGDKDVTITQNCESCRTMDFYHGWLLSVENIKFSGGTNQIYQSNPNTGASELLINGCEFQHASDYAVLQVAIPSKPANDGHISTNLVINHSKFNSPTAVVRNIGDLGIVRDSQIEIDTSYTEQSIPIILNHYGALTIKSSQFKIINKSSSESNALTWISNNANLNLIGNNFDTESLNFDMIRQEEPPNSFSYDGFTYDDPIGSRSSSYPFFGGVVSMQGNIFEYDPATSMKGTILVLGSAMPSLTRINECPSTLPYTGNLIRSDMNLDEKTITKAPLSQLVSFESSCMKSMPEISNEKLSKKIKSRKNTEAN